MHGFLLFAQDNPKGYLMAGGLGFVVIIILASLLWLLPVVIAIKRGHQNATAIIALDLLLGWTLLGWVAALVWSLTAVERRSFNASADHFVELELTTADRLISTTLGVIGGVMGGASGYVLFFWIANQGLYALVLPGASIGLGCGLLARHPSVPRGIACAVGALGLGLYTEWKFQPFVADNRFPYLVLHFYSLRPITLIMIGLGAALAFYLGKDAGFLAPRNGKVSAPSGGIGE